MEGSGRFERYRILSLLDRGGMGSVHRAHDERLDREIALKLVRGPGDEESRARVLREARAVAALEHPNVVAIYDVGSSVESDGGPPTLFIAMELVRGDSMRTFIGNATIPLEERVRWLRDMADALAYAHERGIIHRDVKPENVMIRSDGVVKVLDFGIARRGPTDATSAALPTLTEKGTVLGTPRYMAPEQMLGEDLDGRADQFSWGVVAYELLAGKPPWSITSDSLQAVAEMLMNAHTPLRAQAPNIPEALETLVERAIRRARRDRFASMRDVLAALDDWLASVGAAPRGAKRTTAKAVAALAGGSGARRGATRWVVAAVGILAAAAIAAVAARVRSTPALSASPASSGSGSAGPGTPRCSARECTRRVGAAALCKADGSCAALASDDCRVVSAPGDENDDRTVWLGAMFPLSGPDGAAFGLREFRAVDLARSEVARVLGGTHSQSDRSRPLALVACDDARDGARAARHLVDVGVPAVIGFRTSQEAIDVATSTLLPKGVLGLSALNTSPVLTHLPQPPGQPRLIWRTAVSAAQSAAAAGEVVPRALEPIVRAHVRGDIRVALVRQDDPAGRGFADALFRTLAFNGKSAMDNGASFEEVLFPFAPAASEAGADVDAPYAAAAAKVAAHAPHVIVYFGSDETFARVLVPLERQWRANEPRPLYLKPAVFGPAIAQFAGHDAGRRHRFFGMTNTSSTIANARFVARYGEAYDDTVTRTFSPNSSYDSFYLLAYATYAVGDAPVTGASLARAFAKLVPPGDPIDVGPEGIFPAFAALEAGRNVDLNGASGHLDFDLEAGESPVDLAILCLGVDAHGAAADSVESGLVLDSATHSLRGTLACP